MDVRRALALTLVFPLLLVGCTEDEPTPKMPDPPTTSSSTPSPTASETPEAESAEDFIRRWVAAGDDLQSTGDSSQYRAASAGCEPCDALAERVEDIYDAGGGIEYGNSKVLSLKADAPSSQAFKARIRYPGSTVRITSTASPTTFTGGPLTLHIFLKGVPNGWAVKHFTILASS